MGARTEEMALTCQGTEERGQILRVCKTAETNLTQASVDDKQLTPSCLAASVRHLLMIRPALGLCQQPPGFGPVFVKKALSLHLQVSDCSFHLPADRCLRVMPHLEIQGLLPF